jgi:hypothetical protein
VIAIVGALLLLVAFQALGLRIGLTLRRGMFSIPPLRSIDTIGGFLLGAASGLVLAWVVGVVALQLPGQTHLRQEVQRSLILRGLNGLLPPDSVLQALARIDPFPALGGPVADVPPPNPRVLRLPGVRRSAPSVVRILGTACGLGIEGSGWVGERDASVQPFGSSGRLSARAYAFDPTNDVAVLHVPGLRARPLPLADARPGAEVAVLGYPNDGPFTATPGRIGTTRFAVMPNAYGNGPVGRTVTTLRGTFRHGNSGGPAVDAHGAVLSMIFAAQSGTQAGYGIPPELIRAAAAHVGAAVSTGSCGD